MTATFVCYSRQLKDDVVNITTALRDMEHEIWFDQVLKGGQTWWDEILDNIRCCDVFIAALSPATLESQACNREWNYAASLGKPILPVVLTEGVSNNLLPPVLSKIHYVDYRKRDSQAAFSLIKALEALPESPTLPETLPDPPPVPLSYLADLKERIESERSLNFEEQSAITLELQEAAQKEKNREDILTLIDIFCERDDLLARIDKSIQALRAKFQNDNSKQSNRTVDQEAETKTRPNYDPSFETNPHESLPQTIQWRLDNIIGSMVPVLGGVLEYRHIWHFEIDELNTIEVSREHFGHSEHLAAALKCRDGLLAQKEKELDKLGWKTKDHGIATGLAGSALLYATSGLGLVALGSKEVRDYIMTIEATRHWPVSTGYPELKTIASELKVALEIIGPDTDSVTVRRVTEQI